MTPARPYAALAAAATLLAGACAEAPPAAKQPASPAAAAAPAQQPAARPKKPPPDEALQIAPANGDPIAIQQTPEGRDLCEPGVPESRRRAAGVDCEAKVEPEDRTARGGIARDPLLDPKQQEVQEDFESLGLGDDVPATVILQQ